MTTTDTNDAAQHAELIAAMSATIDKQADLIIQQRDRILSLLRLVEEAATLVAAADLRDTP